MSMQDAYVGRGSKEVVFVSTGEQTIVKSLAAKANAVRRLERQGRRSKFGNGRSQNRGYAA